MLKYCLQFGRKVHEKKEHPNEFLKESDIEEDFEKLNCKHCKRVFYEQHLLDQHLKKHAEDNLFMSYACSLCGLGFNYKNSFLRHVQNRHKDKIDGEEFKYIIEKKITCNFCEAKFFSRVRIYILTIICFYKL